MWSNVISLPGNTGIKTVARCSTIDRSTVGKVKEITARYTTKIVFVVEDAVMNRSEAKIAWKQVAGAVSDLLLQCAIELASVAVKMTEGVFVLEDK